MYGSKYNVLLYFSKVAGTLPYTYSNSKGQYEIKKSFVGFVVSRTWFLICVFTALFPFNFSTNSIQFIGFSEEPLALTIFWYHGIVKVIITGTIALITSVKSKWYFKILCQLNKIDLESTLFSSTTSLEHQVSLAVFNLLTVILCSLILTPAALLFYKDIKNNLSVSEHNVTILISCLYVSINMIPTSVNLQFCYLCNNAYLRLRRINEHLLKYLDQLNNFHAACNLKNSYTIKISEENRRNEMKIVRKLNKTRIQYMKLIAQVNTVVSEYSVTIFMIILLLTRDTICYSLEILDALLTNNYEYDDHRIITVESQALYSILNLIMVCECCYLTISEIKRTQRRLMDLYELSDNEEIYKEVSTFSDQLHCRKNLFSIFGVITTDLGFFLQVAMSGITYGIIYAQQTFSKKF